MGQRICIAAWAVDGWLDPASGAWDMPIQTDAMDIIHQAMIANTRKGRERLSMGSV
jgi:hypothetical protein